MEFAEQIFHEGVLQCIIVRPPEALEKTSFVTPNETILQVGYIVYPAGGEVPRHFHKKIKREVVGTSEVISVHSGACSVQLYNLDGELIATRDLRQGDTVILLEGAHGFKMNEDTVLMEVKQGPYFGEDEKTRL